MKVRLGALYHVVWSRDDIVIVTICNGKTTSGDNSFMYIVGFWIRTRFSDFHHFRELVMEGLVGGILSTGE